MQVYKIPNRNGNQTDWTKVVTLAINPFSAEPFVVKCLLASCPLGPATAHGVGILTEM